MDLIDIEASRLCWDIKEDSQGKFRLVSSHSKVKSLKKNMLLRPTPPPLSIKFVFRTPAGKE